VLKIVNIIIIITVNSPDLFKKNWSDFQVLWKERKTQKSTSILFVKRKWVDFEILLWLFDFVNRYLISYSNTVLNGEHRIQGVI